jgi:hypothetical protein
MRFSPNPADVRELVVRTFGELDVPDEVLDDLSETILLDDGRYFARSYRTDDCMAMWLIDVGVVQFYDADGAMLRTVNLFEEFNPVRAAA